MGNPTRKVLSSLDLIPAVYDLLDFDHGPEKEGAIPYYLDFYRQIEPLARNYDYIIFDCPPALGRASKCAAFCSPEIYIPAHPDFLSSLGIKLLSQRLGKFLTWQWLSQHRRIQKRTPWAGRRFAVGALLADLAKESSTSREALSGRIKIAESFSLRRRSEKSSDADHCSPYSRRRSLRPKLVTKRWTLCSLPRRGQRPSRIIRQSLKHHCLAEVLTKVLSTLK